MSIRDKAEMARQIAGAKRLWIYTKLAQRERLSRPRAAREFVTGEGFSYLGRTYRLKLLDPTGAAEPPLRLQHGRFLLLRMERQRGQEHFVQWYARHGRPWLQHRVEQFAIAGSVMCPLEHPVSPRPTDGFDGTDRMGGQRFRGLCDGLR